MNRVIAALLLVIVAHVASGCSATRTQASQGACPVCQKPIGDGPEVRVIRAGTGGDGTQYRCFMCPIMEGKTGENWTMRAVSGLDGKWVTFHVNQGHVQSDPPTAVVLAVDVGPGDECLDVHRVFVDESEFRRYVAAHPRVKDVAPQTLEDVLKAKAK